MPQAGHGRELTVWAGGTSSTFLAASAAPAAPAAYDATTGAFTVHPEVRHLVLSAWKLVTAAWVVAVSRSIRWGNGGQWEMVCLAGETSLLH